MPEPSLGVILSPSTALRTGSGPPGRHELYEIESLDAYPTIDEIFELLEEYERQDIDHFEVAFHTEYCYPTDLSVDPNAGMADEEFAMTISDFVPLSD